MKRAGSIALLAAGLLCGQAESEKKKEAEPVETPAAPARGEINLLGKADTAAGESRRNENVQFNLIDNNALKEANLRLGTTATITEVFRADRGYFGAEFGNRPASPILMEPSKGSGVHGNVFLTHGNTIWNARSFFTVGDLPAAHENQYGAAVTMGLWRGAAMTLDAGQQKIRGNVNGNVLVPLPSERVPRSADPAARALLQRFLDAYPKELPNRTDINERALNTNAPQRINDNNATARLDQQLGRKDTLSFRYSFTAQFVDAFQFVAGQNPDTTTRAHAAQIGWTRNVSAASVLQATAMFDRTGSLLVPEPNAVGPQVNFSNVITTLGPGSSIPIDRAQNRFRYATGWKQARGRHNFYAGVALSRRQLNGSEVSSHRGNLYFRNDFGRTVLENFLLGVPSRFSGATGSVHRGFRQWETAVYAGDSFRANRWLTLDYGVRHEAVSVPVEVNGLNRLDYSSDRNNFAPRFGFAARLPRKIGVIRGAAGVHFGEIFAVTFGQVRYNPPLNQKFELQAPDLFAPFARLNVAVEPDARATFLQISPRLATPYAYLYNFSWEPEIGQHWKLQLGYTGSRAHKLLMLLYANRGAPVAGIPQITATINDRRPDARYYDLRQVGNNSRAYFDAARVTLVMPRWKGLTLDTSYWFSKAMDLGSTYTNTGSGEDGRQSQAQSEFGVREDVKSVSAFDHKHAFLTRGSWTTPALQGGAWARVVGQWELSGVALVKSGLPFSVITGSDAPGFGNVDGDQGDRPNLLDASILGRTIGHPDGSRSLLPRSAFAYIRPTEARGNLGNNTFRKAGIANVNASVGRSFSAGGDRKLVLRAESVNLFNTPQFAEPWREVSSPSFGSITNTLNEGRVLRFLARFQF